MTSSPPSAVLPRLPHNPQTVRLPWGVTAAAPSPNAPASIPLPEAYRVAVRLDRARPPQAVSGYRLYWVEPSALRCRDVLADPSASLVVGRHTECDAVLASDPRIALRHLLVRCTCLDDGCPVISVVDLQTHQGFELSDGTTQRSISATGPIALRLGGYSLIALPAGFVAPDELPAPTCARGSAHKPMPQPVAVRGGVHSVPSPMRPYSGSRVTLLPSASMLSQRPGASFGNAAARQPSGHANPHSIPNAYHLTLRASCNQASVWLADEDLALGILVGREPRCVDAGLRALLSLGISRTHLLILRENGRSIAYDLASTQGTYEQRRRVRSTVLSDDGSWLALGATTGIEMHWRGPAPLSR